MLINCSTRVSTSLIHGYGLFTNQFIQKGQIIWKKGEKDIYIPLDTIPINLRDYLDKYATVEKKGNCYFYFLDGDDTKYMNHNKEPNIMFIDDIGIAINDIPVGSELTCDYLTITTPEHFEFLLIPKQ